MPSLSVKNFCPLWTKNITNTVSALSSSFQLWHNKHIFCMNDFVFMNVRSNFKCHNFPSVFVRVLPLFNIEHCKYSFLYFPPILIEMLWLNVVYDLVFMNVRSTSSVVNFANVCRSHMFRFEIRIFYPTSFGILSSNFVYDLIFMNVGSCSSFVYFQLIFVGFIQLWELTMIKIRSFHTFLQHALKYWAKILYMIFIASYQVWVLSIYVHICRSYSISIFEHRIMEIHVFLKIAAIYTIKHKLGTLLYLPQLKTRCTSFRFWSN